MFAFTAEQNYSQALKISLLFAQVIYPILAPFQLKEIFANVHKGKAIGKKGIFC